MKYELILSGRFKKSLKTAKRRGLDIRKLHMIVDNLLQGIPLEAKYKILTLTLVDTGSHADLFKK